MAAVILAIATLLVADLMNKPVPNNYPIYLAFVALISMLIVMLVSDNQIFEFLKLKWKQKVNSTILPAVGPWVSAANENQIPHTHTPRHENDVAVEEL